MPAHTRPLPRLVAICGSATALLALVALPQNAAAQPAPPKTYPGLSIAYLAPTGEVEATESIDVWVRLSLASDAVPFTFDGRGAAPWFGLPEGYLPATARPFGAPPPTLVPFGRYTAVVTAVSVGCSGTFGGPGLPGSMPVPCREGAYRLVLDEADSPGRPRFGNRTAFTLHPGETYDFIAGTFRPVGGVAPLGSYVFHDISPIIALQGFSDDGRMMATSMAIASTCRVVDRADCQPFSRTVVPAIVTPEPATAALLAAGIAVLGAMSPRRRRG